MHKNQRTYNNTQIFLHWAIAALILFNYFVSEGMGRSFYAHRINSDMGYNLVSTLHIYVGLTIIALVAFRIIVRFNSRKNQKSSKNLMDKVSHITHEVLYLLMFLVPVFGAAAWYLNIHVMGDVHEITVNIMMLIVLLHAAAALFHQYVLKDDVLLKMLGKK